MLDWLTSGVGSALSGLFGGVGSFLGASQQASAQEQINQQQMQYAWRNMAVQQHAAQGENMPAVAENVLKAASILGVNPVSMVGAVGAPGAPSVVGAPPLEAAPSGLGAGLRGLGAGLANVNTGEPTRLQELKEQALRLDIDNTKADIVHKNLINAALMLKTQPGNAMNNGVPLPMADPRFEPERIAAWSKDTEGRVWPSRGVTERSFSSIPGLPASVSAAGEAVNLNDPSARPHDFVFPPSVARALGNFGDILGGPGM